MDHPCRIVLWICPSDGSKRRRVSEVGRLLGRRAWISIARPHLKRLTLPIESFSSRTRTLTGQLCAFLNLYPPRWKALETNPRRRQYVRSPRRRRRWRSPPLLGKRATAGSCLHLYNLLPRRTALYDTLRPNPDIRRSRSIPSPRPSSSHPVRQRFCSQMAASVFLSRSHKCANDPCLRVLASPQPRSPLRVWSVVHALFVKRRGRLGLCRDYRQVRPPTPRVRVATRPVVQSGALPGAHGGDPDVHACGAAQVGAACGRSISVPPVLRFGDVDGRCRGTHGPRVPQEARVSPSREGRCT